MTHHPLSEKRSMRGRGLSCLKNSDGPSPFRRRDECEGGDLNPYGKSHWILSPARLPAPPPSLFLLLFHIKEQMVKTRFSIASFVFTLYLILFFISTVFSIFPIFTSSIILPEIFLPTNKLEGKSISLK